MPRLSDSMEEGTIVRWLKRDGDEVARGEELVEIETDKATLAYESDTSGTLQITAQEGATLHGRSPDRSLSVLPAGVSRRRDEISWGSCRSSS